MVVYDEIETFRNFDDPEFMYPYGQRKNKLYSQTISLVYYEYEDKNDSVEPLDYTYQSNIIRFQGSEVCLESKYWMDLINLFPQILNFIKVNLFKMEPSETPSCEGPNFLKVKYSNHIGS